MAEKFVLKGEPARLLVAEVIELLARHEAASEATAAGESPVFEQGAVGHDILTKGWHGRHSFDVRILKAEREWSSLIAQAMDPKNEKLVISNRLGRPARHLGMEHGFLSVAAVAQWLADDGADVELDGVRVAKTKPKPEAVAEPVVRMPKAALVAKHERSWSKIENDLKEATRQGNWLAPARLDRGYYDERVALDLAKKRGHYLEDQYPKTVKHTILR